MGTVKKLPHSTLTSTTPWMQEGNDAVLGTPGSWKQSPSPSTSRLSRSTIPASMQLQSPSTSRRWKSNTPAKMDEKDVGLLGPSFTYPVQSATVIHNATTPAVHVDLASLANAIFDIDHSVTRIPANLHPPIYPTTEDARAFPYSLVMYVKETSWQDLEQLRVQSQTTNTDARTGLSVAARTSIKEPGLTPPKG
ncbi:unnamed protein product [Orchesella dallaii]|uniref:Uncharacterized protein n=1 Tax=Orchesella dallaii TaxID=48710 RepID=A0ABP1RMP1_9HEXA